SPLSLHDALPISGRSAPASRCRDRGRSRIAGHPAPPGGWTAAVRFRRRALRALATRSPLAFLATRVTAPRIRRRESPSAMDDTGWDGLHPVMRRVYAARGVASASDVAPGLGEMTRPDALGGLDAACALISEAIETGQRILVVGDFDCDGATGAALAVRGLRLLGATRVDFEVPHRLRHGYGLSPALVADLPRPLPDLLITVDSGIACVSGVAAAKSEGCR